MICIFAKLIKYINNTQRKMNASNIIRFAFIIVLWLVLCYLLITRSPKIDFMVVFTIVASGIVIFVPLYKKYMRGKK